MGNQAANIRQLKKILHKVKSYKEHMRALSDEELSGLTDRYKKRLAKAYDSDWNQYVFADVI